MATTNYFLTIFLTSLIFNVVARPINIGKDFDYAMEISSLAAIKIGGGPSAGGEGHEFPIFGNMKNSGPSVGGKGHDFTNAKILGEIKNSGPSPGGKGHGFPDHALTLGNIKNHGISYQGKGYETTRSGPAWVERSLPYSENFWSMKNSGPSPGGKGH